MCAPSCRAERKARVTPSRFLPECSGESTTGVSVDSSHTGSSGATGSSSTRDATTVPRTWTRFSSASAGITSRRYATSASSSSRSASSAGMAVPGSPAWMRHPSSVALRPPFRYPARRSRGQFRLPSSSKRGSSCPRPSSPWQFAQWARNEDLPRASTSSVGSTSATRGSSGPGVSPCAASWTASSAARPSRNNRMESPSSASSRTKPASAARSSSPIQSQAGMAEPGTPRRNVRTRSSSVGAPPAVRTSRKRPCVKSRGAGNRKGDAGPSPAPR